MPFHPCLEEEKGEEMGPYTGDLESTHLQEPSRGWWAGPVALRRSDAA